MMQRLFSKKVFGFFLLFLTAFGYRAAAQVYCTTGLYTSGCSAFGDQVESFSTTGGSTNITNNNTGCANAGGYSSYTAMSVTGIQGQVINYSLTATSADFEYYAIYIDWNQNGTLNDAGEVIYASTSTIAPGTVITGSFTVPPGALTGCTRLRVRCTYGSASTPCGSYTWGEVEDYTACVIAATNCTGTPAAGTASATPNPVCPNQPFTLTSTGYTNGGGITYQWQSGPSATGPWGNITGATSPTYVVAAGITVATFYRLQVICTPSASTVYSNVVSETIAPLASCYCTPTYSNGCGFQDDINTITLVASGGTGFNQPNTGCSPGAFIYYNSLPAFTVIPGCSYSGTINSEYTSDENVRVWIDFNDDGTFAPAEQVGTITSFGTTLVPYTITIPSGVAAGVHRMRYRLAYFTTPSTIDPCILYTYGETHDYNVTVLSPTPTAPTVVNSGPACSSTPFTITATSNYCNVTYSLTGPGVTGTISNTTGIFSFPSAACANNGTYSITATSGGFTSPATTTNVVINCAPTIALGTITNPTTCASATGAIQINGLLPSTAYNFIFYRKGIVQQTPAAFTSTAGGSYTITGLTQGTYDSIRVQTVNLCFSNLLGPVTLSDPNPPPAPVITTTTPLCSNTVLTLCITSSGTAYPAGAATVYSFTTPANVLHYQGINSCDTINNFTAANNGIYKVFVTVNGCTSPTTTKNVTVTPASAAPTVTNVSYCQGEFALPIVNSVFGINDSVYTGQTGGIALPYSYVPSTATPGSTIFYATQATPCPNIPRTPLTVTIKPRPLAPVSTSPTSLCQFEIAQPLTAQGTALLWYTTATGGSGTTTAPTPVTTVPGTFNFYVTQTVNGCEGPRTIITVTVKPKPAPPGVTSPLQLCQNDPPSPLTAQGQGLRWYTTPTGGVGVTQAPVPNVGYEDSFFYYVSQTVNGCESDRARIKVVVNYRPNGIILATRPWVCAEDTISFQYFGNGLPGATYNWHTPHPQTTIISGDHSQGPLVVSFNTAGTQVVTLQVNNRGCLSPLLTAAVSVRPLPTASFVHSKDDICTDQIVNIALNHTSGNISGFNWTGFDGANVAYGTYNGGPFGLSWSQPGEHVITLVVTSNECNSHPITDTVLVHAYPDATIHHDGEVLDVCSSDSVKLNVIPGSDPATYEWTPAAYFYNRSDSSATVYAQPKYTGTVRVTVTSIYGCAAKDSVDITTHPCCGVTFPTAFAPGGNVEKNRRFRPITIGNHEVLSFRVINRWGVVVYESRDERSGWDGTYNGQAQDMGQFYYYFRYKCSDGQDLEEKGEVLLMR